MGLKWEHTLGALNAHETDGPNHVLPKPNGESHRGPRLRARDGDPEREAQEERVPGLISGTRARTHTQGVLCFD